MTSISSSLSSLIDPLASSKAGRVLLVAIGVALGVTGAAHAQTGPGGVGNAGGTGGQPVNALWLRADQGISTSGGAVTTWADQSGNGNDATQSSGDPTLLNSAFNGKPAVEFVASDQDVFRLSSTQLEDLATGNNTLIIVSKRTGNEGNQVTLNFDNSSDFGFIYSNLEFRSIGYNVVVGGGGGSGTLKLASMSGRFGGFFPSFSEVSENFAEISQDVSTSSRNIISSTVNNASTTPTQDLVVNSELKDSGTLSTLPRAASDVLIGALNQGARAILGEGYLSGNVAEVIAYDGALNAAELRIVYNYLSEKYGIQVANDLYAYTPKSDVAGVGKASSALGEAPQGSHTTANSAELRLSTTAASLNGGEYILFGHDGAPVSFSQAERPNGETTAQKIGREWRVDLENASSQSVDVSVAQGDLPALPSGFNDYAVFVDEDGDFSSGATFVDLELNGSRYEASGVSISDGDYVTIAAVKRTIAFAEESESDFENTSTPEPPLSLELNYPNQSGLPLGYNVSPGANGPTNDTDYETCCEPGQSATFTFPANQTTYDLQDDASTPPPFGILDDGSVEDNTEFVEIAVDPSSGAGAGLVAGGDVTTFEFGIVDDDQTRTVSLGSDDSKAEDSGSNFTVTITLENTSGSDASGNDVTVGYELSGSATAGEDYENLEAGAADSTSGNVTIPAGQTSTSFDLKILDDDTFETDEDIVVTLVSAEGGATLKSSGGELPSQTFTMVEDESPPTVALSSQSFTGTEGSQANATVQLSAAAGTSVDVTFSVSNGSATGGDYTTVTTSPATIAAGQTKASIAFDLTGSDGKESTETFSVTLTGTQNGNATLGSPKSADINIIDADGVGGDGPGGVGDSQSIPVWLSADRLPLSDGSEVTTWPDRSGNGNDATVLAGNGPDFQASVSSFNNRPVVRFNGSSDYLNLPGISNLGRGPNTVFAVSATNTDARQGILTVADVDPLNGSAAGRRNLRYNTGLVAQALNGGGAARTTSVSTGGTPSVLGSAFDGGQIDVAANRESPATASTNTGSGTSAVLGAELQASNNQEEQINHLDGDVAELVVYNQELNTAQRIIVANALAAKYGVSLTREDYYAGDTNAGYEQRVIGIGAERSDLTEQHTQAAGGGVRLVVNSFSTGNYVFVGDTTHASANDINIKDVSGSSNVTARSDHLRYLDTEGQPTFDITIDLQKFGLQGPAGDPANYRLLFRDNSGSGAWSTPKTMGGRSTSGNKVTFSGVQFGSKDKAAYITIGTTNQVASPLDTRLTTVRGTPGANGSDKGWRYYGPPGSRDEGPVQMGEIRLRTPNGRVQTVDFRANMSYTWSSANGEWVAASADTEVPAGRGSIIFLYDDSYVPIDPELTIDPQESGANGAFSYTGDTDVMVGDGTPTADDALTEGVDSHLLANPYEVTYDLGSLQTLNQDGDGDETNDWATAVQVWDYSEDTDGGDPRGTYKVRSTDPAKPESDRLVSPGQAFFLARNDLNGSGRKTKITFSADGRQNDRTVNFVGTKKATDAKTRRAGQIKLRLRVHKDGDLVARDRAASLYFREGADSTWDAFDAPKLVPLDQSYATIAIQGTKANGETALKAQESRPYMLDELLELPLALTVEGVSGDAAISAPEWWEIPANWTLTLIDTKGTQDPSDDVKHSLQRNRENPYTFSVGGDKQKKRTESKTGEGGVPTPPSRLKQDRARLSKSDRSTDARFRLRVNPGTGPLPVEMAELNTRTDGKTVLLKWATASETNNAGFYVEHKRLAGDSTASSTSGTWARTGFVDGSGTTDAPQEYRHEITDLNYGQHAFRLRQVDTDGSETTSDVVKAEIRLDGSYSVSVPYPNPVRQRATLEVTVRETQPVRAALYDVLGRRVRTVYDEKLSGQQTRRMQIRVANLSSGLYFVRVEGEDFAEIRRMTVVK